MKPAPSLGYAFSHAATAAEDKRTKRPWWSNIVVRRTGHREARDEFIHEHVYILYGGTKEEGVT